jgi:hypothetical protein
MAGSQSAQRTRTDRISCAQSAHVGTRFTATAAGRSSSCCMVVIEPWPAPQQARDELRKTAAFARAR